MPRSFGIENTGVFPVEEVISFIMKEIPGYWLFGVKADAADFGMGGERLRWFIIGILFCALKYQPRTPDLSLASFMLACRRPRGSVKAGPNLLKRDSKIVHWELRRLISMRTRMLARPRSSAGDDRSAVWVNEHSKMLSNQKTIRSN